MGCVFNVKLLSVVNLVIGQMPTWSSWPGLYLKYFVIDILTSVQLVFAENEATFWLLYIPN